MRIILASSEVVPFSKTGGLADVASALPAALARRGHEVTIITPRYGSVDIGAFDLRRRRCRLGITVKGKAVQGGVLEGTTPDGIPVLFVDQPSYFDREGLYGADGKDFDDNDERFSFFCRAVLETCRVVGLAPDVIHCNDWQTGPIPILLQTDYRDRPELNGTGTVFTIHNLAYQGLFPPEAMMTLGLPWNLFTPSTMEYYGKVSFIKAGLVFADRLTTVSRKYAKEIRTPDHGCGLDRMLSERAGELKGILNGVDYSTWDPRNDRFIAANYSSEDLDGKATCKADLQQRMGLPRDPLLPLIGCVGRLTHQKGLDLFLEVSDQLLQLQCQWLFLGTGDPPMEEAFRQVAQKHPDTIAVHIGYHDELAHRIEAGADLFLMPSRYEPCGLNQIYSLRYGTIPMVHAVGGLDDTIDDVSEGGGNGFKFHKETPSELFRTVRRALQAYADRDSWKNLMKLAMSQDFSWDFPARRYEGVYREVIALRKQ
jgi:starch synthase